MPVLPLLAFVACSRVNFTFTFTILHLRSTQIILILTLGTVLLLDAVFALHARCAAHYCQSVLRLCAQFHCMMSQGIMTLLVIFF